MSDDAAREEKIEYLVQLMLAAKGWPESNDLNEYYDHAERLYDAGCLEPDFGCVISDGFMAPLTATARTS